MRSPDRTTELDRLPLPTDTAIGRVYLRVADVGRALGFYQGVLGLHRLREEDRTAVVGTVDRELLVLLEHPGIAPRPRRPVTAGLYHVALLLPSRPDLGRTLLALQKVGYPLRGMSDHGVSESLYLDDLDGNGLEIYADRPRERWPRHGSELIMSVDPLDVADLIAAARDSAGRNPASPWEGLPPGTTVGHVHFTVSRLERAAEFYHRIVGFDITTRWPKLVAVAAGGYHHHLNLNTWAGEGAPPDSNRVAGLADWELRIPSDAARSQLTTRLAKAGALRADGLPGGRDPDGNQFRIVS